MDQHIDAGDGTASTKNAAARKRLPYYALFLVVATALIMFIGPWITGALVSRWNADAMRSFIAWGAPVNGLRLGVHLTAFNLPARDFPLNHGIEVSLHIQNVGTTAQPCPSAPIDSTIDMALTSLVDSTTYAPAATDITYAQAWSNTSIAPHQEVYTDFIIRCIPERDGSGAITARSTFAKSSAQGSSTVDSLPPGKYMMTFALNKTLKAGPVHIVLRADK